MVQRQFPKPSELKEFMTFKKPSLDFAGNRLEKALTIYDLRKIAKRRTPAAAFDYTDGAAEGEFSMNRARQAFEDIEFHPRRAHRCFDRRHPLPRSWAVPPPCLSVSLPPASPA